MESVKLDLSKEDVKGPNNEPKLAKDLKFGLLSSWRGLKPGTQLKIKAGFSILMFASLFTFGKVDVAKSWQAASAANFKLLFLAAITFLLCTFLNAYRWQLLSAAVGFQTPFLKLVQYCFMGLFFNLFLPSTVGGDASRCYYLAKGTHKYRTAFYSVFIDRTMGIAVLFLFASLGLLLGPGGSTLPWSLKLPIYAGTIFIYFVLPFVPFLARTILGPENWVTRQLHHPALQTYQRNKKLLLISFLLSVILQVIIVVCHIIIGFALGLYKVPLWYYFVFYPCVAVLGFITPSFNGLGIREWAYTHFLFLAGVDRSLGLTYAIIWLSLITLSSLVGGLVYMAGHFRFSAAEAKEVQDEMQEELQDPLPAPLPEGAN